MLIRTYMHKYMHAGGATWRGVHSDVMLIRAYMHKYMHACMHTYIHKYMQMVQHGVVFIRCLC
jgi:hypothetical protein